MAKEVNHIVYKQVKIKHLEKGMVLRKWGEIDYVVKCGEPDSKYPNGRKARFVGFQHDTTLFFKGKKELNEKIEVVERVEKKIKLDLTGLVSRFESAKKNLYPKEYILKDSKIIISISPGFLRE